MNPFTVCHCERGWFVEGLGKQYLHSNLHRAHDEADHLNAAHLAGFEACEAAVNEVARKMLSHAALGDEEYYRRVKEQFAAIHAAIERAKEE